MSAFGLYVLLFVVIVLGLAVGAVLVNMPVPLVVGVALILFGGVIMLPTIRKSSPTKAGGPTTDQPAGREQPSGSELSQNVPTK